MLESPEQGAEVLLVIVVIITASMCMDAVVNILLFFIFKYASLIHYCGCLLSSLLNLKPVVHDRGHVHSSKVSLVVSLEESLSACAVCLTGSSALIWNCRRSSVSLCHRL